MNEILAFILTELAQLSSSVIRVRDMKCMVQV